MNTVRIVKIGGKVLEDPSLLTQCLKAFASIEGPKVLIHGGGKTATELGQQLGVDSTFHKGRRITSKENLKVNTMAFAGWLNTSVVAQLYAIGTPAIGIAGADGGVLLANKRSVHPIDFGHVGDITEVNTERIQQLLDIGLCPVVCAITHDGNGALLNANADGVAAKIAIALQANQPVTLQYIFEFQGVLQDLKDANSVLPKVEISERTAKENNTISDGMIAKFEYAIEALQHKVAKVQIGGTLLLSGNHKGTTLCLV